MDMKAIILIIVLLLIGWGIWYFVGKDDLTPDTSAAPVEEVQGSTDVNLEDFQDKG